LNIYFIVSIVPIVILSFIDIDKNDEKITITNNY